MTAQRWLSCQYDLKNIAFLPVIRACCLTFGAGVSKWLAFFLSYSLLIYKPYYMKTFSCLFLVFGVGLGLAGERVVHEVLQLAGEEAMLVLPGGGAQPGYEVSIGRLETGDQDAGLMLWYQGHDAADACRVAIGQVTGSGDLALSAMSTCTLNVFRLTGSAALAGFPGNLTLSHYSSVWDKDNLSDTAAVLELDSAGLSGSVMLDVAGYCEPEGSYFISALGVSGSCSIGGLDAAIETTMNLPKIPGGKKIIYPGIRLPLTAIADFAKYPENPLFAELAVCCEANGGLWNLEAEKILLKHFA